MSCASLLRWILISIVGFIYKRENLNLKNILKSCLYQSHCSFILRLSHLLHTRFFPLLFSLFSGINVEPRKFDEASTNTRQHKHSSTYEQLLFEYLDSFAQHRHANITQPARRLNA